MELSRLEGSSESAATGNRKWDLTYERGDVFRTGKLTYETLLESAGLSYPASKSEHWRSKSVFNSAVIDKIR